MSQPCKGNIAKLIAMMDRTLRPAAAERLRAHVESCEGCFRAYQRLLRASDTCQQIDESEAIPLPWRKIETQIYWRLAQAHKQETFFLTPPQIRPRPFTRRRLAFAATGAALLLVIGLFALYPFSSSRSAARQKPVFPPTAPVARPLSSPIEQELAAVATMLQGEVQVISALKQVQPLDFNRPLLQGSRITSNRGQASLQWSEGCGLLISENTDVVLQELRHPLQSVVLERGRAYFYQAQKEPGRQFSVTAHSLRVIAQGSYWALALDAGVVTLEVFNGHVDITDRAQRWPKMEVSAGYQLTVSESSHQKPTVFPLRNKSQAVANGPNAPFHLLAWPSFYRMMATTGLLALKGIPLGVELRLDSKNIGTSNLRLRTTLGPHRLELWRKGQLLHKQWIEIHPHPQSLTFNLSRR
jgi:ferric-dicitrate binding protein FerR (iron transport regulator)